ncbi:MAG TPA: hypothetical protein VFP89_13935 [Propionibacteriaceae bacterium]|nr:hypothetical protein [Propionibacteriaceae bacterium]
MTSAIAILVAVSKVEPFRHLLASLDRQDADPGTFSVIAVQQGLSPDDADLLAKLVRYRPNLHVLRDAETEPFAAALSASYEELVLPLDQRDQLYPRALSALSTAAAHADLVVGKPVSVRVSSALRALPTSDGAVDAAALQPLASWLPALVRRTLLHNLAPDATLADVRRHAVENATSHAFVSRLPVVKIAGSPAEDLPNLPADGTRIGTLTARWENGALALSTTVTTTDGATPGSTRVWLRHLVSGLEWPLDTSVEPAPGMDGFEVSAVVDPSTAAQGSRLDTGQWVALAQVTRPDGVRRRRLPIRGLPGPALVDRRMVVPTVVNGRFVVDIGATVANPVDKLEVSTATIREDARGTRLSLPLHLAEVRTEGPLPAKIRLGQFPLEAEIKIDDGEARLESWLSGLPGTQPVSTSLAGSRWHPTGAELVITATGEMSIRAAQTPPPAPKPAAPSAAAKPSPAATGPASSRRDRGLKAQSPARKRVARRLRRARRKARRLASRVKARLVGATAR